MSNPVVERLAWTLIHSAWQGAVVAIALLIALGFAYRASSNARYILGCFALALLLALPIATFTWLGRSEHFPVISHEGGKIEMASGVLHGEVIQNSPSLDLLPLLVVVWVGGVMLFTLRLLGSMLQIERWRRRATQPADEELVRRVRNLAARFGIRGEIAVVVADDASVPSAWGVVRPVLSIPIGLLTGLPSAQIEAILLHELAHIRRFDYLVNVLQTIAETVLFFHPATWWISSLVRREREHCCDDFVVATLGDPLPYARALLRLEERRHALPNPALSAKGGPLMNRIQRILARPAAPSRLLPTASAFATLGLLSVFVGGAIQAQAQERARTAPQATTNKSRTGSTTASAPKSAPTEAKSAKSTPSQRKLPTTRPTPARTAANVAEEIKKNRARVTALIGASAITSQATPARKAAVQGLIIPARPGAAKDGSRPVGKVAEASGPVASAENAVKGTGSISSTAPPSRALGFGNPMEFDLKVELTQDDKLRVDSYYVPLAEVVRRIARAAKCSVVIEQGDYAFVTAVLSDESFTRSLDAICQAGNATYRIERNIYYVSPLTKTPQRVGATGTGGFGGGAGLGGGVGNGGAEGGLGGGIAVGR